MKPLYFYLNIILINFFVPVSNAALLDQPLLEQSVMDIQTLMDDVEQQTEVAVKKTQAATQTTEKTLQHPLLKAAELKALSKQDLLNPQSNIAAQALKSANHLLNNTYSSLQELPDKLVIRNAQGKEQFTEVKVENNWRAVAREWLVMLSHNELNQLKKLSLQLELKILEENEFPQLNMMLVRFKVTDELDSYTELWRKLPNSIKNKLDRNHVYSTQAQVTVVQKPIPARQQKEQTKAVCKRPIKVGMLDTAIDSKHIAFKQSNINQRNFIANSIQSPLAHGTAVAALLVSSAPQLNALLPNAELYAAAVFYPQNEHMQGASLLNLIKGIDWLLSQKVSVINMSLAGPPNQILAQTIQQVIKQNVAIVAAAGNEGPTSADLYPAAYMGVITATAVDKNNKNYRWANRGKHIDFSARGVSVLTARVDASQSNFGLESGTSIATPVITAFVACKKALTSNYLSILQQQAIDLGPTGHDNIFGYGLLTPND